MFESINITFIVLVLIIIILIVVFISMYNSLIVARNRVKNSWAQINVQLKRRADLIPNLIETVKGYASHEKSVFEKVSKDRNNLINADTVGEKSQANNELTQSLKSLFAIAENYPELKANENFLSLQEQLAETEDKIAYSRQFYNDTVLMYNNKCQKVPSNIIANLFGFNQEEFFDSVESSEVPKVNF